MSYKIDMRSFRILCRFTTEKREDTPFVTTRYPPIASCLRGLTLGLYRKDGTFHILREAYVKHGVMYCVENRELTCVNSLLASRRPRWIDHVYVSGFVRMPVKEYLEATLSVQIF